jgi:chloride channel protein, CIC family
VSLLDDVRGRLASAEASLPLSMVGAVCGLFAGAIILTFRLLIESAQASFLPGHIPENYEAVGWIARLAAPALGGLVIGLVVQFAPQRAGQVGVLHVMERLYYHEGRLPLRNAVMQYFGGALAIVTGHSVGREGPGVHLGAAGGSLLGQWLRLPNNSIRTLVACGAAASIGASFNTPIAGVIFAMEVVLLEYTLSGFIPVMLASVAATSLTWAVYGPAPAFSVPALHLVSLWELPYIVFVGSVIGLVAAGFIHAVETLEVRARPVPPWSRATAAGLVTGACALAAPEIMGVGYDTVQLTLDGKATLLLLVIITLSKLVSTAACVGLGTPGGVIGPTFFIGATAGGALGIIGHSILPDQSGSPALYAVLGMGAMMSATLQAPLSALMAILELTGNTHTIFPGMLAVVTAALVTKGVLRKDSMYTTLLRTRGLEYAHHPVAVSLSRTGVAAVMSRKFVRAPRYVSSQQISDLLSDSPGWVLVCEESKPTGILQAAALPSTRNDVRADQDGDSKVDLTALSGFVNRVVAVRVEATLREALSTMYKETVDLVCIKRDDTESPNSVCGLLTRNQIEELIRFDA